MSKWNMIVDAAKCENCGNCYLSTVDEYTGNDHPGVAAEMPLHGHKWIEILKRERGQPPMVDVTYAPVMCNHCDDAPCMEAAENGAITKRADGIVIIDPVKSKGQRQIVDACPYGAVYWNEEKEIPQAWPFDAHLLDQGWQHPRCVQSCPTGALRAVKVDDAEMARIRREEGLEDFRPDLDTKPRVHYKNLGKYRYEFIGGTVAAARDGIEDCVEGAEVVLRYAGDELARTITDNYGDFQFDGLRADSGVYAIEVSHPDFPGASTQAELGKSTYVGTISLGS